VHVERFDLSLLAPLHALLEEASVTNAAARLGLTPSATSHALGRLRDELGDALLVRTGGRMVLTPRAEALAPEVRRIWADVHRVLEAPEEFSPATLRRRIAIAAPGFAQFFLLPALWERIRREAPHVELSMRAAPRELEAALESGEIDLAIGMPWLGTKRMSRQHLFEDRDTCLVRDGHPLLARRLTRAAYTAARHIVVQPDSGPGRGPPRREGQLARDVAATTSSFYAAGALIAASDLLLTTATQVALSLERILPVRRLALPFPSPGVTISQFWHTRLDKDPTSAWLRRLVHGLSRELRPGT
jgi:DNA-binding transcriptional LysR family regulator